MNDQRFSVIATGSDFLIGIIYIIGPQNLISNPNLFRNVAFNEIFKALMIYLLHRLKPNK